MSPFEGIVSFIATWWLPLIIVAVVAIFLIWLFKWLKRQKEKRNIFLMDYNRTKNLCKHQANRKRIRYRSFWLYLLTGGIFFTVLMFVIAAVTDDIGAFFLAMIIFGISFIGSLLIRLGRFFAIYDVIQVAGRFGTKVIGYYLGECITSDGYKNILSWNSRKYIFWKNEFVVKVNLNKDWKIEQQVVDPANPNIKKREIISFVLPNDLLIEGEDSIIIKGEGLDIAGYYYYPVLKDQDGNNIVNMDLVAYARARDVAILDTLYQQTEDFVRVQREAINLNPNVRYVSKTKGESVESSSQQ